MFATTHPDATAFAARFLANPQDQLGRLVFADWLEERGDDSSVAWAQYLRCMAQAEEESDTYIVRRAEVVGRAVRARLTLMSVPGTPLLARLTAFLPDYRIWVRIGEERVPPAVVELCPETIARQHCLLPIDATLHCLFVISGLPVAEQYEPRVALEFILDRDVVKFRGFPEDVVRALNNHYGWPEAQFIFELPDRSEIEVR